GVEFVPGAGDGFGFEVGGDDHDAIGVGDEQVAGGDADAADFDGDVAVDDALAVEAVVDAGAAGEDGELHGGHLVDVSDGAVDDGAGAAGVSCGGGEQFAPDAGAH